MTTPTDKLVERLRATADDGEDVGVNAILREAADAIERQAKRITDLETALRALLWPNVPSGDDVALMIRCTCGSTERSDTAMPLADRLRDAQAVAQVLLYGDQTGVIVTPPSDNKEGGDDGE